MASMTSHANQQYVGVNVGLGEGQVHSCPDADIDPLILLILIMCIFHYIVGEYSLWWILVGFLVLLYLTVMALAYAGFDL